MELSVVETALEVLRPSLALDGFDLRVGSLTDDGNVTVVLEAKPEACVDCMVPDELMVQILENAIRERVADLERVTLVKEGFDTIEPH
jgi:Fe-S cluster biogenesis protein NfuA